MRPFLAGISHSTGKRSMTPTGHEKEPAPAGLVLAPGHPLCTPLCCAITEEAWPASRRWQMTGTNLSLWPIETLLSLQKTFPGVGPTLLPNGDVSIAIWKAMAVSAKPVAKHVTQPPLCWHYCSSRNYLNTYHRRTSSTCVNFQKGRVRERMGPSLCVFRAVTWLLL
jgi:hypothetical protein